MCESACKDGRREKHQIRQPQGHPGAPHGRGPPKSESEGEENDNPVINQISSNSPPYIFVWNRCIKDVSMPSMAHKGPVLGSICVCFCLCEGAEHKSNIHVIKMKKVADWFLWLEDKSGILEMSYSLRMSGTALERLGEAELNYSSPTGRAKDTHTNTLHAHRGTHTRALAHRHTHTKYARKQSHTHYTHTYAHTHTQMHTHAVAHTHTHLHTRTHRLPNHRTITWQMLYSLFPV